jgi:hypothetical protein
MTIKQQINADMDKAEKTNLKVFLDHLYLNALTYTYSRPKTILGNSIKDWFNLDIKGNAEGTDENCFVDAMLQGKTTCAAHHMMKILAEPDSHRKEYLNRKIQLLIWAAIDDEQFKPDDPITRMTEMFENNNLDIELHSEYGHEFLGILHVSEEVCEVNAQRVAEAATYLVDKWLVGDVMWKNTPAVPGSIVFKDNQPSSPTDDLDDEKVVLKEGETVHVELIPYDYNGKTEQMCAVTLHIGYNGGRASFAFRPLEKVVPGDYIAKCDVTMTQLVKSTYEANQDTNGDGKCMRRVLPTRVSEPASLKESTTVGEGTTEPYYEKMKEVLHHIAELSTVTNGGHTGCTHDPASWAEEFMRNVTALFSFDLTRNIRPDCCKNKFDRISDLIVKRFDDRSGDNTVLSNIGSVLQIVKMLACVRRDNVQDHPTPHGYEYVIDYNKYWSMIKKLYGIDLSDTPKYTNDHRYHLMAALKGAAD